LSTGKQLRLMKPISKMPEDIMLKTVYGNHFL